LGTYRLLFKADALKEWKKLGNNIRNQFEKKLRERLHNPRVVSAQLSGMPDCYKIKLKAAGYRIVYRVDDDRIVVIVVAVGRRDRNLIYRVAGEGAGRS
jgi:mRNA interferase RelE/StbE